MVTADDMTQRPSRGGARQEGPRAIAASVDEVPFRIEELFFSRTDARGRILSGNDVFQRVSLYGWDEMIERPHNIIRHPEMPRCIFKYLWDTIRQGDEVFAYVVNLAKNGNHYWVLAHVTPSYDRSGELTGFHSNRRSPNRNVLPRIQELYRRLLHTESRESNPREAAHASYRELLEILKHAGQSYDEFIWNLIDDRRAA